MKSGLYAHVFTTTLNTKGKTRIRVLESSSESRPNSTSSKDVDGTIYEYVGYSFGHAIKLFLDAHGEELVLEEV